MVVAVLNRDIVTPEALSKARDQHRALVAVAEASRSLLAHHRINKLRAVSDTLDERFKALDAALEAAAKGKS